MKLNDWIVANINNPDFTVQDFKAILGLDTDNTQLLPMEEYIKSSFITDAFKTDSGEFDKDKFTEFYQYLAGRFSQLASEDATDNYEFGFWDVFQKPNSRVRNPRFNLDKVQNPDHVSTGVIGINKIGERTKTPEELAQKLKIYDWEKQQFLEESPEDNALFAHPINFLKNIFSEPLVMATYDADVDEIENGQLVHHSKGEKKLNENGEYYYETLGGRSILGKQVLSLGDILTKEDSAINKYDFFDSDDIDKSIGGTIAKNVSAIAPLLLGGPASIIYSGVYVAREIAKSLPMLYNIATIFSDDNVDPQFLNTVAAYGQKFSGGTSEYGREHAFSFENFGNLIADVALQWGQLKMIAQAIGKIRGGLNQIMKAAEAKALADYEKQSTRIWNLVYAGERGFEARMAQQYTGVDDLAKIADIIKTDTWKNTSIGSAALRKYLPEAMKVAEKRARLGLNLSLAYMSIISNADTYQSALEAGASKTQAAAVALGATLGMFAVDKWGHLGEIFFDDSPEQQLIKGIRQGLKEESSELAKRIGTQEATKEGYMSIVRKGMSAAQKATSKYLNSLGDHTAGFIGKAIGEGVEEVSEELVTDLAKSMYQLAGQFGWIQNPADLGAFSNVGERYGMSFFGGAVGGGLFYGVDAISNPRSAADREIQKELLYLVKSGHTKEILDELDKLHQAGKLGNKNLSMKTTKDEKGNNVYVTASGNDETLNDFIYKTMRNAILQMESIINGNQLNLTDDELFERMVLSDRRYIELKSSLFDKSYITLFYDDYQQLLTNIYNTEKDIDQLNRTTSDEDKRTKTYQDKLINLEKKRNELLTQRDDFFEGNYNTDYVEKMLFHIHPEINSYFYDALFPTYVENKYHKTPNELSEAEHLRYRKEFDDLRRTKGKQTLSQAFDIYKNIRGYVEAGLYEVADDDLSETREYLERLRETGLDAQRLKWDSRLPQEDVDAVLANLGVVRSSEYDKPLGSDPSKSNKAFDLYLEEFPNQIFQIVKDQENNNWSIHFKTTKGVLNEELKKRLFTAAAAVIPEGDNLSTWGSLTKGGISGIARFGDFTFVGHDFESVGTRKVKLKDFDFSGRSLLDLLAILDSYKAQIGDSKKISKTLYDGLVKLNSAITALGGEEFDLSEISHDGEENENDLQDIEIPVWRKVVTSETTADYEERNILREGESDEDFARRKLERYKKINLYNDRHLAEHLRAMLNATGMIDRGTFRLLMAIIPIRALDRLKGLLLSLPFGWGKDFNTLVQKSLTNLKPDGSNKEEVIDEIIAGSDVIRDSIFNRVGKYSLYGFNQEAYAEDSEGYEIDLSEEFDDQVSFQDLLNFFNKNIKIARSIADEQIELGADVEINPTDLEEFFETLPIQGSIPGSNSYVNKVIENALKVHNLEVQRNKAIAEGNTELAESLMEQENALEAEVSESPLKDILEDGKLFLFSDSPIIERVKEDIKFQQSEELHNFIDSVLADEELNLLNDLKKHATLNLDPMIKVMRAVLPKLGEDFSDVESLLESIYTLYDSLETPSGFMLNDSQITVLQNALRLMRLVEAVVYAAKNTSSYFDYLPYNKSINEFIRNHSDVVKNAKELLELDDDIANTILESIAHYRSEITEWIEKGTRGTVNKQEMFLKFDLRFNQAKMDFFKTLRASANIGDKDLMEGYETITLDKPDAIVEIEKLIYNNYKRQGWTLDELMTIFKRNFKATNILNQTSSLKDFIEKDSALSDYDKFTYLIALLTDDPINFYEFYKGYVKNSNGKDGQKIAPLTFLEHTIRLTYAQQANPDLVNSLLRAYLDASGRLQIPVLQNATIILGIGGTGKTDVVIRATAENESTTWISGPTPNQTDNLSKILNRATIKSKQDLLEHILGKTIYAKLLQEIKSASQAKEKGSNFEGELLKTDTNAPYPILKDITYQTVDNPKQVVIDEITLFSNAELLVLGNWAEKAGIKLIFAGDSHQNGNMDIGFNIGGNIFGLRTPEMNISLRDANIWKYRNQQALLRILDSITETNSEFVRSRMKEYQLSYFVGNDTFTGDMIVEDFNNIPPLEGSIAFIGNTASPAFEKLRGKTVTVFESVDQIQGSEFDYVIVDDLSTKYKDISGYKEHYLLRRYLNNLYTIITRSRKGTIILNNGLTLSIGAPKKESYSTNNIGITPKITEKYVEEKLAFLNSLNLAREVPLESKETPLTGVITTEPEPAPPTLDSVEEDDTGNDNGVLAIDNGAGIFPVFGYISLSGLVEKDGKLVKANKDIDEDLGIFLPDNAKISGKDRPLKLYYQLKSLFLYDKEFFDYDKLSSSIKDIISKEALENAEYYVTAEPYSNQYLISTEYNLKNEGLSFSVKGNPPKVYLVKARFKNKSGKTCELTLGGLANPETLRRNADKSKEILNKIISEKASPTLQHIVDNYDLYVKEYEDALAGIEDRKQIKKPTLSETTGLYKHHKESGNKRLLPITSFSENPAYVVSPVYTQVNDDDILFPELADAEKGKGVIFVSGYTLYKPDELIREYLAQKADPTNNRPRVRKIILETTGPTFEDLCNHRKVQLNADDELVFPFSNTAVGFRMYISLWNFRAKLSAFNDAIVKWLADNGVTMQTIKDEALAHYQNKDVTTPNLDALNLYLADQKIQLFRVGYNPTNGFFSGTLSDGTMGTFINPDMAIQYYNLVNKLFESVIDKLAPRPTTETIKAFVTRTSDAEKQNAFNTWVRKLREGRGISIDITLEDGVTKSVPYSVEDISLFKALPLILVKLVQHTNTLSALNNVSNYEALSSEFSNYRLIAKDESGKEIKLNQFEFLQALEGGLLQTTSTGNPVEMVGVVPYNSDTNTGTYDRRIINMFNLAFHGRATADDYTLTADGTIFKYGIFADTFLKGVKDPDIPFRAVSTSPDFYLSDVRPTTATIRISFAEVTPEKAPEPPKTVESYLEKANKIFKKKWRTTDKKALQTNINQALKVIHTNIFKNQVSGDTLTSTIHTATINGDDIVVTTIGDLINSKIPAGLTIESITASEALNPEYYVNLSDGSRLIISRPDTEIVIQKQNSTPLTEGESSKEVTIDLLKITQFDISSLPDDWEDSSKVLVEALITDIRNNPGNAVQFIKDFERTLSSDDIGESEIGGEDIGSQFITLVDKTKRDIEDQTKDVNCKIKYQI